MEDHQLVYISDLFSSTSFLITSFWTAEPILLFFQWPTTSCLSGTFAVISAPAPTVQESPKVMLLAMVALTPMKQDPPISQNPETTIWDARKQLSLTVEWCPIWFPLQRTTLFPMLTNGWIVLCSKIKQCSPTVQFRQTKACELMYDAGMNPFCFACKYRRVLKAFFCV